MTSLSIPDFDPEASVDEAAMGYAAAGWYVLPIDPQTKHAGSVLGKGWPAKSSRDPKQIIAWLAGSGHGLALHVGRSGAVVFDVDDPGTLPPVLAGMLDTTKPPHQSSRAEVEGRGHYLFTAPAGRSFSNGAGALRGGWGEVRGRNGIIVVFPTAHSKGGRYQWLSTGPLPELPAAIAAMLPDSTDADATATDAEAVEFLTVHRIGDRLDLADVLFERLATEYAAGVSRHVIFTDVTAWAMREARAGLYPAMPVANRLREQFVGWMATARNGSERTLPPASATAEFMGILSWAVAQAQQSTVDKTLTEVNGRLAPPVLATLTRPPSMLRREDFDYSPDVVPSPLAVMLDGARRLATMKASTRMFHTTRWGWADRMPVGELTLIPGREGVGKSLFLAWLAAQLTRGTLPGEWFGVPRDVLYVASEDSWEYTIGPRMMAAGADLDRVWSVDATEAGYEMPIMLPLDCEAVADTAIELGAAALMLDPIVSLIDDRLSVNQTRELRRALEPLRRAAERAGIMVPALAHFNKTTDTDVLSKIPGGRGWVEVARAAFAIAEDKDQGCYVAAQVKNNLGRVGLPTLSYVIDSAAVATVDGTAEVGRLRWTGETESDLDEVLSRKPERRGRPPSEMTNKVIDFIESQGRPVALAEIYTAFPMAKPDTLRKTAVRAAERGDLSRPLDNHFGPADDARH